MCGIAGIIKFNSQKVSVEELEHFSEVISHRGPDSSGYKLFEDGKIGLAHKRLTILDSSPSANQPMAHPEGEVTIVYNGEIFNFIEIREQLEKKGYKFKTETDTEVVLKAYHYWGKECFNHFNGMWAMAIYHHVDGTVLLSRDRFGIKPLFFLNEPSRFVFASETNCFKYLKGFNRSFNVEVLEESISDPYYASANNTSIFEKIKSVKPGHWVSISSSGELQNHEWYSLKKRCAENPQFYEKGKFKSIFLDAVKIRLRSDVGIATAFSGGMDSTAVFSSIKHLANSGKDLKRLPEEWQMAFTVAISENSKNNDWPYAKLALEELKAKFIKLETKANEETLNGLIETSNKADCIVGTPLNIISQIYEGMHRNGYTVSMDGHGADEYLFGYRNMVNQLFYSSIQRKGKKHSRRIAAALAKMYPPDEIRNKQKQFILEIRNNYKAGNYFKRLARNTFNPIEKTQELIYENLSYSPLPGLLHVFDKASMLNSVEIRMPFMDYRLIEYCYCLENKYFINEEVSKWLLRDELKDILPTSVLNRTSKIGIGAPVKEWLKKVNPNQLDDFLNKGPNTALIQELERLSPSKWFQINLQSIHL